MFALCFCDVWPVVLALSALDNMCCLGHRIRQAWHVAWFASDNVEPCLFLGSVAPPFLWCCQSPPTERIAFTGGWEALRRPQRATCRVLQDTAKLAHHGDSQAGQVAFVWPWVCECSQASPGSTRRVRHNRMWPVIDAGIALHVVNIAARDRFVNTVCPRKKHSYCLHRRSHEKSPALQGCV